MKLISKALASGTVALGLCSASLVACIHAQASEGSTIQELGVSTEIEKPSKDLDALDSLVVAQALRNGWKQVGSEWYYYQNGVMLKNKWVKDKDLWYYLSANGTMSRSAWIKTNARWYHVGENGAMQTDQWLQDKGKWYYLQISGEMVEEGWVKSKDLWYYFDNTGAMVSSRWVFYKDNWYYLSDTGAMHTGMLLLDSKVYYLDEEGRMLKGWQRLYNDDVYFDNSGAMQATDRRALLLGETSSDAIPLADIYAMYNTFERLSFNGRAFKTIENYPDKTKDQVVAKIKSFFANSQDSDVNYLFITTHGGKGYLVIDKDHTPLYASELRSLLDGLKGKFVVMIDACHSGSLVGKDAQSDAKAFVDEFLQANSLAEKGKYFNSDKYIIFASSTGDQLSYGSRFSHMPSVATHAWSLALGWDQLSTNKSNMLADGNKDERVSIREFSTYSQTKIKDILTERYPERSMQQDMVAYPETLAFNVFSRS